MAAMRAVRDVLPIVPAVSGITEVDGRPGVIMERVDGPDLLTLISKKPWIIWSAGGTTGHVQAQLHGVVAPESIPTLKARVRRIEHAAPPELRRHAEFILRELDELPDGDRLCHGDLHPANILMTAHGPVVIDWPNVTRGDPMADLARTRLMIRMGALPPGTPLLIRLGDRFGRRLLGAAYMRGYRRVQPIDKALVARWEVVRAADRLLDDIPEERAGLIKTIEAAMQARGVAPH